MPSITSIRSLLPAITEASQLARQYYRCGDRLGTRLKADRSVVTEADTTVEALLRRAIGECFSGVNILGEEGGVAYDPSQPYTFVIDPIDGTLAFTCGTPGWAICVGVLDHTLQPVAGIISAPSWDSLFVADLDPQSPATYNGTPLPVAATPEPIDNNTTILIDSRFLQTSGSLANAAALAAPLCTCVWWHNRAVLHWRTPVRCTFGTLLRHTPLPRALASPCSISMGRHWPIVR